LIILFEMFRQNGFKRQWIEEKQLYSCVHLTLIRYMYSNSEKGGRTFKYKSTYILLTILLKLKYY